MKCHVWRAAVLLCGVSLCGCATTSSPHRNADLIAASGIPRELQKTSLPVYRVAPPDILIIEAVQNIRPPSDPIRTGDVLNVRLANPEPLTPADKNATPIEQQAWTAMQAQMKFLDGPFRVQADGTINLGPIYGRVRVEGLTVQQAKDAVQKHLTQYIAGKDKQRAGIRDPRVAITMPNISGKQIIAGEHLVRPDGTIALGVYGSVYVAGQTLAEVKRSVEAHLSRFIHKPEVSVDVGAYNSQVYYVVMDGGGFGETVMRLPCTGNETVLDAIANVQGLSQVSSKRIWVARPSPAGTECAQVLDVNWREIAMEGITTTNYQLLPGDRIYVSADHLIATDNFLAKALAPVERIFGVTILGYGAVRTTQRRRDFAGGGFGGGAGF